MSGTVRSKSERRADTLASLASHDHLWLASASQSGKPHLVPLSYAWTGGALIIATASDSPTALNLLASGLGRVAIGPTGDVVMVDVEVQDAVTLDQAPAELADAFAAQSDWDPRTGTDLPTHYFTLAPTRIQAWRSADELPGRTIMAHGKWLEEPEERT
jgi:Pyridoxamine 5'-phosphate oxidase